MQADECPAKSRNQFASRLARLAATLLALLLLPPIALTTTPAVVLGAPSAAETAALPLNPPSLKAGEMVRVTGRPMAGLGQFTLKKHPYPGVLVLIPADAGTWTKLTQAIDSASFVELTVLVRQPGTVTLLTVQNVVTGAFPEDDPALAPLNPALTTHGALVRVTGRVSRQESRYILTGHRYASNTVVLHPTTALPAGTLEQAAQTGESVVVTAVVSPPLATRQYDLLVRQILPDPTAARSPGAAPAATRTAPSTPARAPAPTPTTTPAASSPTTTSPSAPAVQPASPAGPASQPGAQPAPTVGAVPDLSNLPLIPRPATTYPTLPATPDLTTSVSPLPAPDTTASSDQLPETFWGWLLAIRWSRLLAYSWLALGAGLLLLVTGALQWLIKQAGSRLPRMRDLSGAASGRGSPDLLPVLSGSGEAQLHQLLLEATRGYPVLVAPKMRLQDAVPVRRLSLPRRLKQYGARAHLDFTIVDGTTYLPLVAVELEGKKDSARRHQWMGEICQRAGLPLVRVRDGRWTDLEGIRRYLPERPAHTASARQEETP